MFNGSGRSSPGCCCLFRHGNVVFLCCLLAMLATLPACRQETELAGAANQSAGANQSESNGEHASAGQDETDKREAIELFSLDKMEQWERINFGGPESHERSDGQIQVEMGIPLTGIKYNAEDLPRCNYRLELEAKKLQGTDFFCCLTIPVKQSYCSLVVGGWGGTVSGISCIDAIDASDNPSTTVKKFELDQWYTVKVEVGDNAVKCWIDDEQIVDLKLADIELSLRVEVEPCKPLGLCSFETAAIWKNLRLTKLATRKIGE